MFDISSSAPLDWIVIPSEEDDGTSVHVNLSFLGSNWRCLYGDGCPGMFPKTQKYTVPDLGCCVHGFWTYDQEEIDAIDKLIPSLTDDDWDAELRAEFEKRGTWHTKRDVESKKSFVVKGACIFANRREGTAGSQGKVGCAFLHYGNRTEESGLTENSITHVKFMPRVCSQLPIKTYFIDDDPSGDMVVTAWSANEWDVNGEAHDDDGSMSSTAHWWCVAEGSLITTERGQVPIEAVVEGDRVFTRAGYRKVLTCWDNGERPVLEIMHEGGSLFVTEDHKLLTGRGWVEGRHLITSSTNSVTTSGSDVSVARCVFVSLGAASTPPSHERFSSENIFVARQSNEMTNIHADGSTTKMVEFVLDGNFSDEKFPQVTSDIGSTAISFYHSIAISGAERPVDALVCVDEEIFGGKLSHLESAVLSRTGIATNSAWTDNGGTIDTTLGFHNNIVHQTLPAGIRHVYDLTIEGEHEYIANGVVVHNCVDSEEAYTGKQMVVDSMREELVRILGQATYDIVRTAVHNRHRIMFPMPASPEGRKLFPTLMRETIASQVGDRKPKP